MSLSVAIQMDPVETIKIDADSTFAMALEAQARGHGLFHYLPTDLVYRDGKVLAHARPLTVRNQWGERPSSRITPLGPGATARPSSTRLGSVNGPIHTSRSAAPTVSTAGIVWRPNSRRWPSHRSALMPMRPRASPYGTCAA